MPKLKRVKVASEDDLRRWLLKNTAMSEEVMIVTCNKTSRTKHVSSAAVRQILGEMGWRAGQSYTMIGNLQGQVARRP